ncbi:hypothetical protein HOLDEFILI_00359 [Holdemania filiformis DSM 12042]|uniref:Uncharacterized protein n=1 Tax=Holdemania filiformis DSM 12042 TaxID=545696 RepID=B9Y3I3_9FIRM|nr:hypothetical protein HOLDEFILI_00359 [Holdemania filiformis DSM 12042]
MFFSIDFTSVSTRKRGHEKLTFHEPLCSMGVLYRNTFFSSRIFF